MRPCRSTGTDTRSIGKGFGLAVLIVLALMILPSMAAAAAPAPHWLMISQAAPTYFHAKDTTDFYWVEALNDGGAPTAGKITLKDTLPKGLTVTSAVASAGREGDEYVEAEGMGCTTSGSSPQTVECTAESSVPVGDRVLARIDVEVPEGATGPLENSAAIAGGGAPEEAATSNSTPVVAPSQAVPYGVSLTGEATEADGRDATQAGSHPFAFSTLFATNVADVVPSEEGSGCQAPNISYQLGCPELAGAPKDIELQLPPGFVGDPLAVPRCTQEQFQAARHTGCQASAQVGSAFLTFFGSATNEQYLPIYDIEPPPGQPAELGFTVGGAVKIPMFFHLRSDGNYGLTVDLSEISSFDAVRLASIMIWGVPAAEAHDPMRESKVNGCEPGAKNGKRGCPSEALPAKPFLTMPSSCSGLPLELPITSYSWQEPKTPASSNPEASLAALTGCEALTLGEPSVAVEPGTTEAGSPTGYTVNLNVPQSENPTEFATPTVRNVEVTLPEGTVASPSFANGLLACSEEKFGLKTGKEGECPSGSLIGRVSIKTPVLEETVTGSLYVGQPGCAPCSSQQAGEGKMVRLYMEAELPSERGKFASPPVLVKLEGYAKINQASGQITAVFKDNPQLPFNEVEVQIENGPDAPLVNPDTCGPIVASASLTPWSSSTATNISAQPISLTGCSAPGFSPTFTAGMTGTPDAGSFSPFSFVLTRPDGQQALGGVTLHMPPGVAALIAKVAQCPEAQANAGTCSASSELGSDSVVAGPGSEPLTIGGGKVFLTGPYKDAPFGLSIVTPTTAGPYTLAGNTGAGTEVVRAAISVNPTTAAVTITSDPLPSELDGIPLDIQKVLVSVSRAEFMFNPTNCNTMAVTGTVTSGAGTSSSSSYPFQAVNCAALPFNPGFAVSTHAHHTRKNGAYLHVSVTSGSGQANIKSVFVELPKILPSRTETLHMACSEKQFAENPAGCPSGSKVGTAIANTPVLSVPLTGPAIFVSHGGAAFPELDVVLQGDGVTVDLAGMTNIKRGITSSNFNAVPDVPVSKFELTLPEKPYSALSATANLCTRTVTKHHRKVKQKRTLTMPTVITGQNGAVIERTTRIAVQGCGAVKS
jgi:hypothetical protein